MKHVEAARSIWQVVCVLCALYERGGKTPMSDEQHKGYQRLLGDLEPSVAEQAVIACAKKSKWLPTIAEIREEARAIEAKLERQKREVVERRERRLFLENAKAPKRDFRALLTRIGKPMLLPEPEAPKPPPRPPLSIAEQNERRESLRAQGRALIAQGL